MDENVKKVENTTDPESLIKMDIHNDSEIVHNEFPSLKERLIQCKYSNIHYSYTILMILSCTVLLIWTIIQRGHPRQILYIVLEGTITFLFVTEVVIEIFIQREFWKSILNRIDVILCFGCVLAYFSYLVSRHLSLGEEIENIVELVLITIRYILQIFRIISLILHQRYNREQVNQDIVLMSDIHQSIELEEPQEIIELLEEEEKK